MTAQRAVVLDVPGLKWSTGAPEPVLLVTEERCLVAFYGYGEDDDEAVVAELEQCVVVKAGFPNDEVLHGHPIPDLEPYDLQVVENSEWIAELDRIESVHDRPSPPGGGTHYVLPFHDSTVEAVASGIRVVGNYRTMRDAVAAMTALAFPER